MTTQTQQEQVNGIDVAALKQAIADIEANPDAGQTRWTVKSRWEGGTRTEHFIEGVDTSGQKVDRQFQIQIDEPCELCGTNQYANPQEYLLAATSTPTPQNDGTYNAPLAEGSVSRFTLWVGPLPLHWTAVHKDVPENGCTDVQSEGPAKKWEHTQTLYTPGWHQL